MEGTSKTNISKNKIYWTIFIVFILLLGGFFYIEIKSWGEMVEELYGGKQEENKSADLPFGVTLVSNNNGLQIQNDIEGYIFTAPADAVVRANDRKSFSIQNYQEPSTSYGGSPGCKVFFTVESGNIDDVINNAKSICEEDTECNGVTVEQKNIKNVEWVQIQDEGEYVGSGWPTYVSEQRNTLYTFDFQCDSKEYIDTIVFSFEFI